jgi:hypothetical protein
MTHPTRLTISRFTRSARSRGDNMAARMSDNNSFASTAVLPGLDAQTRTIAVMAASATGTIRSLIAAGSSPLPVAQLGRGLAFVAALGPFSFSTPPARATDSLSVSSRASMLPAFSNSVAPCLFADPEFGAVQCNTKADNIRDSFTVLA